MGVNLRRDHYHKNQKHCACVRVSCRVLCVSCECTWGAHSHAAHTHMNKHAHTHTRTTYTTPLLTIVEKVFTSLFLHTNKQHTPVRWARDWKNDHKKRTNTHTYTHMHACVLLLLLDTTKNRMTPQWVTCA